ncbi:MAG: polysaccharide deacetylase family protein [Pararhizobium sp.]
MTAAFAPLDEELTAWADMGLAPRLWLRDDDATRPTAALDRLLALARAHDAPVLLAVIPMPCENALADRLAGEPLVTPAVHGFAHTNQAAAGAKATELTENAEGRTVGAVLAELRSGREKLDRLFGPRLSPILVPPWNRMSDAVADHLGESGFGAVSLFGWKPRACPLARLDTDVDLVDWRGGRVGHDLGVVAAALAGALRAARQRDDRPVGLLTHHLAHDETAWSVLSVLLDHLSAQRVRLVSAEACLAAVRPPQA